MVLEPRLQKKVEFLTAFKPLAICYSLKNLQVFLEQLSKVTDIPYVLYQNVKVNPDIICHVQRRSLKISTCGEDRRKNKKGEKARVTSRGLGQSLHSPSLRWVSSSTEGWPASSWPQGCSVKTRLKTEVWEEKFSKTMDGVQISLFYVGFSVHFKTICLLFFRPSCLYRVLISMLTVHLYISSISPQSSQIYIFPHFSPFPSEH